MDLLTHHPARKAVVKAVGQTTANARLRSFDSGPNHHVVSLIERRKQLGNVWRIMLSVGVHEYQYFACCSPRPGFDGATVAYAIGTRDSSNPMCLAYSDRFIGGAIVHDQDFSLWISRTQAR